MWAGSWRNLVGMLSNPARHPCESMNWGTSGSEMDAAPCKWGCTMWTVIGPMFLFPKAKGVWGPGGGGGGGGGTCSSCGHAHAPTFGPPHGPEKSNPRHVHMKLSYLGGPEGSWPRLNPRKRCTESHGSGGGGGSWEETVLPTCQPVHTLQGPAPGHDDREPDTKRRPDHG